MTRRPIEILLVDDDPVDVRLTRRHEQSKVRNTVTVAGNGEVALAMLRGEGEHADVHRPDVILLDLNMPVMDGHEFLRQVKGDSALVAIPVVVLTTSDEDRDILRSYELHAAAFVTKPVGLTQLGELVRAIEGFWFEVVRLPPGADDR